MTSFKVLKVKQLGEGESAGGPWSRHKVRLAHAVEGWTKDCTIFINRGRSVPVVGDMLDGTIEPPKQEGWSPEFKPHRAPGGGRPAGRPPEERRSIAMQASQKVAVDIVRIAQDYNLPTADVRELVKSSAQQIFEQVRDAESAA